MNMHGHMFDGVCWRFSDVFQGLQRAVTCIPTASIDRVKLPHGGEAAVCRPPEGTEKKKASMFLSYKGIVDDRQNPPKMCSFLSEDLELFVILGTNIHSDSRMNSFDFSCQRSEVKVTLTFANVFRSHVEAL